MPLRQLLISLLSSSSSLFAVICAPQNCISMQHITAAQDCSCAAQLNASRHLRPATKRSRRARHVPFTCNSTSSPQLPIVSLRKLVFGQVSQAPCSSKRCKALLLQKLNHPEFFPTQARQVREQAAVDFMLRMQRSTVDAASLTCPVETAYLGPSGTQTAAILSVCLLPVLH